MARKDRIAGITIEIEGKTNKLQDALKDVDKSLRTTQTNLRDVNKLLKLDPGNVTLLKQKQDLLASAIKDTREKIDKEKEALSQLKAADQTPEVKKQAEALERQIIADEQALESLKKEQKEFGSVAKQVFQAAGEKVSAFGEKIKAVGDKVKEVGTDLTTHVTAPLAAIGGASLAAFNEVDEGLDTIIKKTGATGEAAEAMGESMKNLATQIPTDFATAGAAIGEVSTRFGLTGQELEALSGQFIKFAQLNDTDVSSSIDSVQKALAAYGLGAEDASAYLDRLNKTGQDTGVSVDALASGIVSNAAAFKEMGLSIDEATAFMGQLEKSGANSETVLNGMRKALKSATAQGIPLNQALSDLQYTILNGTSSMDGLTAAYDIFGKSGDQIYGAVKDGTINFTGFAAAVTDAGGSVSDTFEATLDPMDKFKTTINELKTLGAEVGATLGEVLQPILEQARDVIVQLKEKWDELSPETQQAIVQAALIAAAIGPVLVVVGTLISSIGSIVSGIGGLISAMGMLMSPVGLVVAAIAAVVAIGVALYKNWDTIKAKAAELKQKIVDSWNNIKQKVGEVVDKIKEKVSAAWEGMKEKVKSVGEGIKTTAQGIWDNVKTKATSAMDALKANVQSRLGAIKAAYQNAGGGIQGVVAAAAEAIKQRWTLGLDALNTLTGGKLSGLADKIKGVFTKAHEVVKGVVDKLRGIFNFQWKLPHIKLPHLSITGRFSLDPPSVPHFRIDWYKKAYETPYIFTQPTVVGGRGFGDGNGAELVYGRDQLMRDIAAASSGEITINVYASEGMNVNQLADRVSERLAFVQKQRASSYA